jgi:hypothetical protein
VNPPEGYGYLRGTIIHIRTLTLTYPSHIPVRVCVPVSFTSWLRNLYDELGYNQEFPIVIKGDNNGSIAMEKINNSIVGANILLSDDIESEILSSKN